MLGDHGGVGSSPLVKQQMHHQEMALGHTKYRKNKEPLDIRQRNNDNYQNLCTVTILDVGGIGVLTLFCPTRRVLKEMPLQSFLPVQGKRKSIEKVMV